ncbi:FRG domain-containing protein [Rheinheimera sp.]|uniref:FRG domain-containing protein n=1 Tax=Rheinheimera sp. TaxID=1869214 RepID=UPI003D2AE634
MSYCNEAGVDVPANTSALYKKLHDLKQGDRNINYQKLLNWPDNDVLDVLGFAQHYSLPTRMLDWTKHSLKAEYFALDGMNSPSRIFGDERLAVWVLDCDPLNDISYESHTVRVVDVPSTLNRNIVAQSGRFTVVSGTDIAKDLDYILTSSGNSAALEKVTLPWSQNYSLVRYLNSFGINESTIYPNAYGAARAAKRSFNIEQ